MTKLTARQRVEQAVEKVYADQNHTAFSPYEVTELIMAERQRIRRAVRQLLRQSQQVPEQHPNYRLGYQRACDDILNTLRG